MLVRATQLIKLLLYPQTRCHQTEPRMTSVGMLDMWLPGNVAHAAASTQAAHGV